MAAHSAGILLYRITASGPEVWLGHMGGPFWSRKQERAWSIPKGEAEPGEGDLEVARREFEEELGVPAPDLGYDELGTYRYSSGKTVTVFVAEAPAFELPELRSGTFDLEWPPRSGRTQAFPELDEARWAPLDAARGLLVAGQLPVLDALEARLAARR
ncbi:NUDIX domain-containing protein [Lysinimonas soli]|uniref:NUDIX domain-containing protein n=1 Tax=Lysinimonas soli TaxID=1074233 RepID=A0ABW0NMX6_9MICO